jgi:hypothetical protein
MARWCMGSDLGSEIKRLLGQGKTADGIRRELELQGYASGDIADALTGTRTFDQRSTEERRNAQLLGTREVFDRIGYGGATPQFINILFWLSQSTHPYILPLIGALNGLKTLLSVVWSTILQEYSRLNRVSKNSIAAAGIIFGFSFLFMSFGLLLQGTLGLALFAVSFLASVIGIVAYGDLYSKFAKETLRKERLSGFLQTMAHWGVLITAVTLLFAGYLLDTFPMSGVKWTFMGRTMQVYGYLLAFEITAFSFIIAGYVSSLVGDRREERRYSFWQFLKEHTIVMRSKLQVFGNKYAFLLAVASLLGGLLQIIITSYSGIVMYQYFTKTTSMPFLTLAILYAIAIIASFSGPFFTEKIHRSTGLAPMLVFGTMLTAILPLMLGVASWLDFIPHIIAIAVALCIYVIGAAIVGFGQGVLAQRLMDEEMRTAYFQAQSFAIIIPYLILIPLMAIATMFWTMGTLFLIAAAAMVVLVMPIYFLLVLISQKARL